MDFESCANWGNKQTFHGRSIALSSSVCCGAYKCMHTFEVSVRDRPSSADIYNSSIDRLVLCLSTTFQSTLICT